MYLHKKTSASKKTFRNSDGFSIVESLVAVGIMSIVMMGFTQMMWNQSRQTKGFEETLARLDVEKTLTTFLADGSVCGATLAGTAPKTFDKNNYASTSFSLSSIPVSAQAGAADLLAVDQQASSVSNSLKVDTIAYKNIQNTGTDKYTMDLVVTFKGGVRPLRPLNIKTIITTKTDTVDPAIKKVTACNSSSGGGIMTNEICTSLKGAYDAATGLCTDVGASATIVAGTTCPAGTAVISSYWNANYCTGYRSGWGACTTSVIWSPSAPSCTYYVAGPGVDNGMGMTIYTPVAATCTATTWSKVSCM